MDTLIADIRHALRTMRKSPGFLAIAVLTLAFGVGANTAIFSVVHATLLSPLPYANPERLVIINERLPKIGPRPVSISGPDIATIAKLNRVFEGVAGFRVWTYEISGHGEPARVTANRVSSALFPVLGVSPILGRSFTADEEKPGHHVIVLTYDLWQSRFGGDPNVVGQTVDLDRVPFNVVGVMPKSFVFPLPGMDQGVAAEAFVPLALTKFELSDIGDQFDFGVAARLKPGVTPQQMNADLQMVGQGVLETYRLWAKGAGVDLGDLELNVLARRMDETVRGPIKPMLWTLLGAVGFVLLIACVNVGNLLLTRASDRRKEMAVRLALGAGRRRLLQQLLTEGLLLSFAGGGLGLLLALWIEDVLVTQIPATIPRFHPITLNWTVMAFAFALATVTGIAFGLLPGFAAARIDLNGSLKDSGRGTGTGREHHFLRATLVALEVALSVILLVGAGLLLRSFAHVLETNPGFAPERVLTGSIDLPSNAYKEDAKVNAFFTQLLERLRQTPGVIGAGASTDLPLLGGWQQVFTVEASQPPPGAGLNICSHSVILGDYLQAMGIRLLRGRYFNDRDNAKSERVVIVSNVLAERFWPGQDPIGKRMKSGPPTSDDPWTTVVGVVADVKQSSIDAPTAMHTYAPYTQMQPITGMRIAVRGEGDPESLTANVRSAVASLDPQLAIGRLRTMDEVLSRSTAARRFNLALLGSFAVLGLVLASIGIYGVLAFAVSRRTHEIGVRMALGARGADVVRLVVGQSARVAVVGMALGVAGSLALTRLLEEMLYQVRPADPLTFGAVLALLAATALAASYAPARRATRIEPLVALRHE